MHMDTSNNFLRVKFSWIPLDCENVKITPPRKIPAIRSVTVMCVCIDQALVVATSGNHLLLNGVTIPVSWLIYEYSETIEQKMIPGGSNDERLTDVGTRNFYIYNIAQSLSRFQQSSPTYFPTPMPCGAIVKIVPET